MYGSMGVMQGRIQKKRIYEGRQSANRESEDDFEIVTAAGGLLAAVAYA
jgi:hypothetical protein